MIKYPTFPLFNKQIYNVLGSRELTAKAIRCHNNIFRLRNNT